MADKVCGECHWLMKDEACDDFVAYENNQLVPPNKACPFCLSTDLIIEDKPMMGLFLQCNSCGKKIDEITPLEIMKKIGDKLKRR